MPLISSLFRLIRLTERRTDARLTESLRGTDLTGRQMIYLWEICQRPGMSQDSLARLLAVDKSSVTRNVSALIRSGYIERKPDAADRRAFLLYPTDRAYEILPRLLDCLRDWQGELTRGMSPEETELLTELLEHLCDNLETLPEKEE